MDWQSKSGYRLTVATPLIHYPNPKNRDKFLCGLPFDYPVCSGDPNKVTCPKCSRKFDELYPPIQEDEE